MTSTDYPPSATNTLSFIYSIITLEFRQVLGLEFFSVFYLLAGLGEFGLVVDGELPDQVLLVGGFVLQVGDVVLGDFLDDVVVGEGLALLEYGGLVLAHWLII